MSDPRRLLAAYDAQLRTGAETPGALAVTRLGPLRLMTFAGGRGFVTYADLAGADEPAVRALVAGAVEHFRADAAVTEVEWKTRGHDHAPGLSEALVDHGFIAQESESIMLGEAAGLAVEAPLPPRVTLRTVTAEADVRAMSAMADEAFGDPASPQLAEALLHRLGLHDGQGDGQGDGLQLWVAEAEGRMIGSGRVEPVPDSAFAGIWGGSVLPAWRGRGVYRALVAARARAALALGRTLVHSDSTELSRPILERSGLVRVSTTTPYVWSAGAPLGGVVPA